MKGGSEKSGVKRIRIHDSRHSHVSLLIDMGFSALAISDRIGHESSDITFRYAHLFPNIQDGMATELNNERGVSDALPQLPTQAHHIESIPRNPREE